MRFGHALALVALIPFHAHAAEVSREVAVDVPREEVWAYVGPFCAISTWYPGIDSCTEEEIGGSTHRRLLTADGAEFLEKRLAEDPSEKSYSYAIIEGPLPVSDYVATFSVRSNGDGSVLVWESFFEPEGVSDDEAVEVIQGIYDTGLDAIREHFAQ